VDAVKSPAAHFRRGLMVAKAVDPRLKYIDPVARPPS
jgi:hypothetical protein